jgi:hypothetical protein
MGASEPMLKIAVKLIKSMRFISIDLWLVINFQNAANPSQEPNLRVAVGYLHFDHEEFEEVPMITVGSTLLTHRSHY